MCRKMISFYIFFDFVCKISHYYLIDQHFGV